MVFRSGMHAVIMQKNVNFELACKQKGMGNKFECTLQQNGCVEWKMSTLFNRVHVILNGLWTEAATQPSFWKIIFSLIIETQAHFNDFLGREREAFCLQYKNFMKSEPPHIGITCTRLSQPTVVPWAFRLILLMVIKSIYIVYQPQNKKNESSKRCDFPG